MKVHYQHYINKGLMHIWDCWTESPGQDQGCWHQNDRWAAIL